MPRADRNALLLALLAAGVLLGGGCAGNDCTLTPDLNQAPGSCTLAPDTHVTVNVRWCSCGATTVCDVIDAGGGVFQLEPKVNSCDASCPPNPTDCPWDSVPCSFTTPVSTGPYHLYVIDGQTYQDVPLTVSGGGGASCS
jgi:hypothetical protein